LQAKLLSNAAHLWDQHPLDYEEQTARLAQSGISYVSQNSNSQSL